MPEPSDAPGDGDARAKAARLVGVSPRSVGHALKVRRLGTPALVAAVENGKISVSAAARLADRSAEEQQAVLCGTAPAPTARTTGKPEDDVASLMARLRVTWRRMTPERRRDLVQVLDVFLQMH